MFLLYSRIDTGFSFSCPFLFNHLCFIRMIYLNCDSIIFVIPFEDRHWARILDYHCFFTFLFLTILGMSFLLLRIQTQSVSIDFSF
jgi:hypothetical protein